LTTPKCLESQKEALANKLCLKAYIHFCLDEEDTFEDDIDDHIAAELKIFKFG